MSIKEFHHVHTEICIEIFTSVKTKRSCCFLSTQYQIALVYLFQSSSTRNVTHCKSGSPSENSARRTKKSYLILLQPIQNHHGPLLLSQQMHLCCRDTYTSVVTFPILQPSEIKPIRTYFGSFIFCMPCATFPYILKDCRGKFSLILNHTKSHKSLESYKMHSDMCIFSFNNLFFIHSFMKCRYSCDLSLFNFHTGI